MIIPKFRLAWKGGAQEQMNILEKMALLLEKILIELERANGKLTSIDNGVTSVDGKMSTQLLLSQEIVDNTSCACNALKDVISNQMEQTQILNSDLLLSQQIADNTSCACNALGDVNGKLDEIIDLLDKPNPAPLYEFVLNTNSYTVTESDIQNGYFEILGYSIKDGELFDSVIIDYLNIFFSYIQVLQGGIIRIGLMPLVGENGIDSIFNLRQSESDLVRSLYLKYVPVATYLFSYNADGGALFGGTSEGSLSEGYQVILPDLAEKSGYQFVGFTSNTWTGEKQLSDIFIMPSYDVLVTANWKILDSIEVAPDVLNVDALSGSFIVKVTSNVPWSASGYASWVFVNASSGSAGTQNVIVTPDINMGGARSTNITFTAGSAVFYLSVQQDAAL